MKKNYSSHLSVSEFVRDEPGVHAVRPAMHRRGCDPNSVSTVHQGYVQGDRGDDDHLVDLDRGADNEGQLLEGDRGRTTN